MNESFQDTRTDEEKRAGYFGCACCSVVLVGFIALFIAWLYVDVGDVCQRWIGNPVLQAVVAVIVACDGNAFNAFAVIALGQLGIYFLFARLPFILLGIVQPLKVALDPQEQATQNVQTKLRDLLSDDIERLAVHSENASNPSSSVSVKRAQWMYYGGCSLAILLQLIATPLVFGVSLGIFNSLSTLEHISPEQLAKLPGEWNGDLGTILPLKTTIFGSTLDQRNWLLVLVIGATIFLNWVVLSYSVTGWTIPQGLNQSDFIILLVCLAFCYTFLTGTLLLYTAIYFGLRVIMLILNNIILRRLYLEVYSRFCHQPTS